MKEKDLKSVLIKTSQKVLDKLHQAFETKGKKRKKYRFFTWENIFIQQKIYASNKYACCSGHRHKFRECFPSERI